MYTTYNATTSHDFTLFLTKAVNPGDKLTRRVRDQVFVKFERSHRYRDRYRCQEKKSRHGLARDPVFQDPPHAENEPSIAVRGSRLPPPLSAYIFPSPGHAQNTEK